MSKFAFRFIKLIVHLSHTLVTFLGSFDPFSYSKLVFYINYIYLLIFIFTFRLNINIKFFAQLK